MGGATVPWLVMVAFLSYQHGVKQGKLPEPHYFVGATAAMSIAALVGMANQTFGTLFAWALFIGVVVKAAHDRTLFVPAKSEQPPHEFLSSAQAAAGSVGSGVAGGAGAIGRQITGAI